MKNAKASAAAAASSEEIDELRRLHTQEKETLEAETVRLKQQGEEMQELTDVWRQKHDEAVARRAAIMQEFADQGSVVVGTGKDQDTIDELEQQLGDCRITISKLKQQQPPDSPKKSGGAALPAGELPVTFLDAVGSLEVLHLGRAQTGGDDDDGDASSWAGVLTRVSKVGAVVATLGPDATAKHRDFAQTLVFEAMSLRRKL